MALIYRNIKEKFLELIPVLFLFYLCLSQFGNDFKSVDILTFNLQYIIIYYWTLRKPQNLGYGYIFIAGLVNDVMNGLPMGVSSLTYLIVASFARYVRAVTVRVSLVSDWGTFIPAIFISNLFYIIVIYFFGEISLDYIRLLNNSIFTLILYPIFWIIFGFLKNLFKGESNVKI